MKKREPIDKNIIIIIITIFALLIVLIANLLYKKYNNDKELDYLKKAYPFLYSELEDRYSDIRNEINARCEGPNLYLVINCKSDHFRQYSLTSETYLDNLKDETYELIEYVEKSGDGRNFCLFCVTYVGYVDNKRINVSFNNEVGFESGGIYTAVIEDGKVLYEITS